MNVRVSIVEGALGECEEPRAGPAKPGAGAIVRFEGVVRGEELGKPIRALDYRVYEPMATRQLDSLAREMVQKHSLTALSVWHSRGTVGVGEVSFRLVIESRHRKEAIAAMDEFIDVLKKDVPIWKSAVFVGSGESKA